MIQNKRDKDGSAYELGLQAENKFVRWIKEKGWEVVEASKQQDMFKHVDYFITKNEKKYAIDVKSEKKISRSDVKTQTEIIYLEFLNVRGDSGWLYGEADIIAFQDGDRYLMIPRKELIERVTLLVTDKIAKTAKDSLYKLYTRYGRKDLITSVRKLDIEDLDLSTVL